jgi:hypothetical protein
MLFSCVFFLTLYKVWNSPKMFSPQMLLPVWELCCCYDVLLLCMKDICVLYWEHLVTCFLILGLPCMSGVIPCFVRFQSLLAGILLTKYFTLGDNLNMQVAQCLSNPVPISHIVTNIKIVLLGMPLTMSVQKSTITNLTKPFLPF